MFYCPGSTDAPLEVADGYYTVGVVGLRSDQAMCEAGSYCPGDGHAFPCPEGSYGDQDGQFSPECSGVCEDGA